MLKINRYIIYYNLSLKRFKRRLRSKEKRRKKNRKAFYEYKKAVNELDGDLSYENLLLKWLPINLKYMLSCENSIFYTDEVVKDIPDNGGVFKVPSEFCLINNPEQSYVFIKNLLGILLIQKYKSIEIDYSDVIHLDLSTQVFLDIIIKDIITFYNRCRRFAKTKPLVSHIQGSNAKNLDVIKLLFSVGSPVIHTKKSIAFKDIVPYKLCIHDRDSLGNPVLIRAQKDLDTTKLVDYVIDSLAKLNRKLSGEEIEDLSTVIGEILINAEEHATTKYRFSIGYFQEITTDSKHYGIFNLSILNFGQTIYEKFKDPECKNVDTVKKMNRLSSSYSSNNFFSRKKFEEETLWTLYALQEGISSIAPDDYRKRGSGSISFIESFFNLKGKDEDSDSISRMCILSGNTSITFDGYYQISLNSIEGEEFKYMTFNESKKIEDKPDAKYVKFVENYFPGTVISAKILLTENKI